jgi:crossover junction endodeoxyribonuclease RuvC
MTATEAPPRVVGVDPGLNVTGYGVLEFRGQRVHVCEAGVIRSGSGSLAARLRAIYRGMREVLEAFTPQTLALEELYAHYERPTTAILMGHARGVICLAAEESGLPVASYAATRVKKVLTGSGRAGKGQVQLAVQRELGLATLPQPPDVADALAIALCHWYLQPATARLRA